MTTTNFTTPSGFALTGSSGTTISSTGNVGMGFADPNQRLHVSGVTSKPRSISIEPKANGYALNIGCQTFVFESLDNMIYRIHEYYSDPLRIESHFESTNKLPTILSKKDKKPN
jgi:hypothetical protein